MFLRDLWDGGLRISQSVHTPPECNQIDAQTPSSRSVCSTAACWPATKPSSARSAIRDPISAAISSQLTQRAARRFQSTIYHLEPNVKDAPGGLRDLQVLRWLAKLGAGDHDLPAGVPVLFEIRCYLHYLGGPRRQQAELRAAGRNRGVARCVSPEELMRQYFRAVRDIARLANRRLERFESKRSSLFSQFRDTHVRLSNSDFSVLHGAVFFRSSQGLESDPGLMMRLFEFVGRHGLPLATDTEERMERRMPSIRPVGARRPRMLAPFREILRLPHSSKALRAMHETQALEAIFPELRDMEALVIRDFYHRYTVDEHTLVAIETVLELRGRKDDPFGDLASETEELDLLTTALLFHDVGKGTPDESHVDVSRRIAEAGAAAVGHLRARLGRGVVSHRRASGDVGGDERARSFRPRDCARRRGQNGTVEQLKLLTLLTYGDISAVNPAAMTPWRRQLLWNLYTADLCGTHARTDACERRCRIRRRIPNCGYFSKACRRVICARTIRRKLKSICGWSARGGHRGVAVSLMQIGRVGALTVVATTGLSSLPPSPRRFRVSASIS